VREQRLDDEVVADPVGRQGAAAGPGALRHTDEATLETFSGIPMFGLLLLAFLGLREARDRHAVPAGVEPAHAA